MADTPSRSAKVPCDDWLTLNKAAALTETSVRTWTRRAKRERGAARKGRRQSLAVKKAAPGGKGKRVWWVHKSIHPSLTPQTNSAVPRPSLRTRYPKHKVEVACRRAVWLKKWRDLCDSAGEGATAVDLAERVVRMARHTESRFFEISVWSLKRWWVAYNRPGPDGLRMGLEGLVDRRGYARTQGESSRSPDAIAFFYSRYRQANQPTITECHKKTLTEARKRGWNWPPTYSATRYWLRRYDDEVKTCLARDGEDVCRRRFGDDATNEAERR